MVIKLLTWQIDLNSSQRLNVAIVSEHVAWASRRVAKGRLGA